MATLVGLRHLTRGAKLARVIAQAPTLCWALTMATMALELLGPFLLFVRSYRVGAPLTKAVDESDL